MVKLIQKLTVCLLLLCSFAGSLMAQTDSPYVIKKRVNSWDYTNSYGAVHYLAHVKSGETWVLQDATTFDPETCIWYSGPTYSLSGTHHNYYFVESVEGQPDKYHFLTAPLAANQSLGLSDVLPTSEQLKNPEDIYYFYDWDWDAKNETPSDGAGVARGHDDNGWWTVYWVEFDSVPNANRWHTSKDSYHMTFQSGRFREVTIDERHKEILDTPSPTGGLGDLILNNEPMTTVSMTYNASPKTSISPSATIANYSYYYNPAYTHYSFHERPLESDSSLYTYNYYYPSPDADHLTPPSQTSSTGTPSTFEWTVSGEGAQYLIFTNGNDTITGNISGSSIGTTVTYSSENITGSKTATLKLKVTYSDGSTQEKTATIIVTTTCQNPAQAADPVINHNDVTVSWYPTAESYRLYWKKSDATNWNDSITLGNVTSYTIHDLDKVLYQYRVIAKCGDEYLTPASSYVTGTFTPDDAPDMLVYGSIFGGGRAANVTGKTHVVVINCDSIGAIYGGNDIAGSAGGDEGSEIILGVDLSDGDPVTDPHTQSPIRIGSVYGGGNGYYAYGSTSFSPAVSTSAIASNAKVYALSPSNQWNDSVWANTGGAAVSLPTITKTSITVTNDFVKVDSIFGGAKNAFVTKATDENTEITINGGTIFTVFGGNNVGGTLGAGTQKIDVTNTTKDLNLTTGTVGLGRTHGIGYLFGGGNMVAGTTTNITITGGQLDTIFGGGNRESVAEAHLTVNCENDKRITSAEFDDEGNVINYGWDGDALYNVHTLFGGNNRADMNGVPYVTLTSGGVGTAYGGGNAGDMLADVVGSLDGTSVKYGTHMQLNSTSMIVDNLYGGCQMSNVAYSTWVEIIDGHVGTVYGGCNVSGDVGSTRTDPGEPAFGNNGKPNENYQKVQGATYVKVSGGTVYRDVFAGSNGYYHCNDGVRYVSGLNFGDIDGSPKAYDSTGQYIGLTVPTHNETNVKIWGGHIKGNVYAGGNLACVGFTDYTVPQEHYTGVGSYPQFVGMAFVQMQGGEVDGDVYGGGRMASVYGSNSVQVSGGIIHGALYGGNDRTGQVAQITNRVLPSSYGKASDNETDLNELNVKTYVSLTGDPTIGTVYGGGNGAYDYDGPNAIQFCGLTPDAPIQANTFVDININGHSVSGENPGSIGTVFGGGNGVTVIGGITVFLNVKGADYNNDDVTTIFGGNNLGSLSLVPDIVLLNGQVNTVYGGCNKGAMHGDYTFSTGSAPNKHTYTNVGSLVRLRNEYKPNETGTAVTPAAKVSGYVYGGCRMNGVTNNSMVIVEGQGNNHVNTELFGGSDISGVIGGTSQVVVNGASGTTVGNVYAGGNGHYFYSGNKVYEADDHEHFIDSIESGNVVAPSCVNTLIDMWDGTAQNLFGGGYAADVTTSTEVNILGGNVTDGIYGGCYSMGNMGDIAVNVLSNLGTSSNSMVNGIYGGGYGQATRTSGNVTVTIDKADESATAPTVYADVYGGSALGQVNDDLDDLTKIDFKNGNLYGNIFGGGKGQLDDPATTDDDEGVAALVNGDVLVDVNGGSLFNNVYGGCNLNGYVIGDINVEVNGGNVGTTSATADVFGGGYGHNTTTKGNVTVTVNKTGSVAPVIYGDVYGGSGFGDVNTAAEDVSATDPADVTTVNILDGTINGNIYGGGLGNDDNPAHVNGNVYVNIGSMRMWDDPEDDPDEGSIPLYEGNATITGDVYGCNNINGTPLDDVFVNIYKTAHGALPTTNHYPENPPTGFEEWSPAAIQANTALPQAYALNAVFGGGNRAAYTPLAVGTGETPHSTTVHVYGCKENTIETVYGGGNAADVGVDGENGIKANTNVIIDGGRIKRMFGGGNGYSAATPPNHDDPDAPNYNPGANIYGTASSVVYAGLIDEVYGGANSWGNIDNIRLNISSSDGCADKVFGKVFGCANEAPLNHSITTTVECGAGEIGELYGGSNLAPIGVADNPTADVTLNLYGGTYDKVFAGSKGDGSVAANIWGDVTLNLFGGTVVDAFGGSNINGSISGRVAVNVFDIESETCPLVLTNVYGASNQTAYNSSNTAASPVVNVVHIKEKTVSGVSKPGIMGNVYGGGNEGEVSGYPQVNIGYDANAIIYGETTMSEFLSTHIPDWVAPTNPRAYVVGNVFGGGNKAAVTGTATVNLRKSNSHVANLFGGGNEAGTTNSVVNVYDGTVTTGVYGGCNDQGTVTNDITVNIYGGTLGTSSDAINIFGGGYGASTNTTGDVTVTIGSDPVENVIPTTPILYGTVYGGSALGSVGAANKLTKVHLKSGTVHGNVFGGGLGQVDDPTTTGIDESIAAHVNGNIQVIGDGSTVDGWIFGANDQNGDPEGTVTVNFNSGQAISVVGGGNVAKYTAPSGDYPYVNIDGGTVTYKVVGGGNEADVEGNPYILISGGTVCNGTADGTGVYGGCNTTGTVTGNTTVTLTGTNSTDSNPRETTIGTTTHKVGVFGGGYGHSTAVTGNVTVNFGDDTDTEHTYPLLYGDLYGGSALGDVNTADKNATTAITTTTVNVLNGTISGVGTGNSHVYGSVFGGGLGVKEATGVTPVVASVYGEVHVNVGSMTESQEDDGEGNQVTVYALSGKAHLEDCDIYGCNNQNGTPKQDVYVDVYQTAHNNSNIYTNTASNATYAIHQVFGGGNESHFTPLGKKAFVYLHKCENTVQNIFGGGNAADVTGTVLHIDGGRYNWVFGGGNGAVIPANITESGIIVWVGGGHIGQLVNGSNDQGNVTGGASSTTYDGGCGDALITDYFLGSNQTDMYDDITFTIGCGSALMRYINLYCGSNLANIYGNINVTIESGEFVNVFGGSKGSANHASNIYDYTEAYRQAHPGVNQGDGGHVHLTITGGKIGSIYGGCDINGNIEGSITIDVDDADSDNPDCSLFIGDIFGGGDKTDYTISTASYYSDIEYSPVVNIKNGVVGGCFDFDHNDECEDSEHYKEVYAGNVFGGGNQGKVTSNPKVTIGSTETGDDVTIKGNVYGGGNIADVEGNTKVILQGKVTIGHTETIDDKEEVVGGDVFGGGHEGNVIGRSDVILGPTSSKSDQEPETK